MTSGVREARRLLKDAGSVLVLTGAGVSAEYGVPTFRGARGLWKDFRPEELATPTAFQRDPRLVWEWYGWRRELISRCDPNPGHLALASFGARRTGVRIVTQNVDGLHTRAAREVAGEAAAVAAPLELHGSLFRARCTSCAWRGEHREPVEARSLDTVPRCAECGALLRPDVVWFGENLDPSVLAEAGRLAAQADVALVVGTSAVVEPAASLPRGTLASGGALVEVNPEETPLSAAATVVLHGEAGSVLPRLLLESPP